MRLPNSIELSERAGAILRYLSYEREEEPYEVVEQALIHLLAHTALEAVRRANEDPIDDADGKHIAQARYMGNLLEQHHPHLHWRVMKVADGWGWWELQKADPPGEGETEAWEPWPWEFASVEIKPSDGPGDEASDVGVETDGDGIKDWAEVLEGFEADEELSAATVCLVLHRQTEFGGNIKVWGRLLRETDTALFLTEIVESVKPYTVEECAAAEEQHPEDDLLRVKVNRVRAYQRCSVLYVEYVDKVPQHDLDESEYTGTI